MFVLFEGISLRKRARSTSIWATPAHRLAISRHPPADLLPPSRIFQNPIEYSERWVQPLSVVDNSVFSPNRLTVLSTLFILLYKEASLLPISSGEDSYDASCVLAPALVCPHVLSRAAVFRLLAPSWSCPVGSSNQAYPAPPPSQATLPTRLPRLSPLLHPLFGCGAGASTCAPLARGQ